LQDSTVKVLVTEPHLRRGITGIIPELFELQHMIVVNKDGRDPFPLEMADLGYDEEMDKASPNFDIEPTGQIDPALMHYTQSDEGEARGVVHPHLAVVQQYAAGRWVLGLRDGDVCWSTADVGRLTGTVLGAIAPWTNGVTQLSVAGELEPQTLYEAVQSYRVIVLQTGPETIATLMGDGEHVPGSYDLSSLRRVVSTGGPLSPKAAEWSESAFGTPVLDAWGQAETGAPLIAGRPGDERPTGSVGKPVPGVEVGVLDGDYNPLPPGSTGLLAVRPGWPSMFSAYWDQLDLYSNRFRKGWYITGDTARADANGHYWLTGDDSSPADR
jgi:acetyl-CoA synthetase